MQMVSIILPEEIFPFLSKKMCQEFLGESTVIEVILSNIQVLLISCEEIQFIV